MTTIINSEEAKITDKMKKITVVAAIIKNSKNQIFCCQRVETGELSLKWEFPGGKVEPGETHKEALYRELKEELDIESNIKSFYTEVEYQYKTFHLTMFCYDVEIVSGKIKLNVHKDSKWINIENLMDLDWAEADIPIVKKLISDFS
jgi:8-oxo-dGTP diphosphatase